MGRSVTYTIVPRINLRNPELAPQFYARAKARGEVNLDMLSERIEKECTLTKADVLAALAALEGNIITALENGEIVQMGLLGTFQLGLNSKGAAEMAKFTPSLIQKSHVNFRAGKGLKKMLATVKYSKHPSIVTDNQVPVVPEPGGPQDPGQQETLPEPPLE